MTSGEIGLLGCINDDDEDWSRELEGQVLATTASRRTLVITWDAVRAAGVSDVKYAALLHAVGSDDDEIWESTIPEYKRYRKEYSSVDGVVTFRGRVVIPGGLMT